MTTPLEQVVLESREDAPKLRREKLKPFATDRGIAQLFSLLETREDPRPYVRALCDLAQSAASAKIIPILLDKPALVRALLFHEDAKTRKITAELLGRADADAFGEMLLEALLNETVDFVRPTLILSLGKGTSPKIKKALETYEIPEGDPKHMEAQRQALMKARNTGRTVSAHMSDFPADTPFLLRCPSAAAAVRELQGKGLKAQALKGVSNAVLVSGATTLSAFFAARSFYDAAVLYGRYETLSKTAGAMKSGRFLHTCKKLFGQDLPYRIELTGSIDHEQRKLWIQRIAQALPPEFSNSPSAYLFEIRILVAKRECFLTLAPSPRLDTRFAYRTRSIAASAHPASAAAVMRIAQSYFDASHHVLDCFCGAGTFLFERARFPHATLSGSDISETALEAARENEKNARTGARFFPRDARARFDRQYDEVICNLPFGLRVGSHEKNQALYEAFLKNLNRLLRPGGIALLFTHDKKLLKDLLPWPIELQHTFSCGGLNPDLFVLRKPARTETKE